MDLYRILPLMIHIIILIKFGYDIMSLRTGFLSKKDLLDIKDMYYIFLCILMVSTVVSLFIKEKRLRFLSILTGIIAFATIWFSDKTFTPEYNKYPLYVPGEPAQSEEENDEQTEEPPKEQME